MPLSSLLTAVNPYLGLASLLVGVGSTIASNRARKRELDLIEKQRQEAQRRYDENYALLSSELADILAGDYQAISPEQIDRVVATVARDLGEMQARSNEQILRDQARRGLGGHSLIDQRQAYVDRKAQQDLADARLQAETQAANLTAQQQAQARSILAGVTADNLQAQMAATQSLLSDLDRAGSTFSDLAGTLLGSLDWTNWLKGGSQDTSFQLGSQQSGFGDVWRNYQRQPTVQWGR